eukprot:gene7092-biopygen16505
MGAPEHVMLVQLTSLYRPCSPRPTPGARSFGNLLAALEMHQSEIPVCRHTREHIPWDENQLVSFPARSEDAEFSVRVLDDDGEQCPRSTPPRAHVSIVKSK